MEQTSAKPNGQPSQEDPLLVVIRPDPAIEFSSRENGVESGYIAHDKRTGKYFRFGAREYHAVSLMDGNRTLADIHRQLERDGVHWSRLDVLTFARELTQYRLAVVTPASPGTNETSATGNPRPTASTKSSPPSSRSATGKASTLIRGTTRLMGGMLTQRFPLFDGDRVANRLLPTLGPIFSKHVLLPWAAFVVSGVTVVWQHYELFSLELQRLFDQQLWLVMVGLWFVLKVIHECGHAVCAKRHGVKVGRMGVMLFLLAPLAYVDVTDAWKLPRRRDRVQIAFAGVHLELLIGAAAAWIWWLCPVGMTKHLAAQVFLVAGPATLIVNANPLLRLDGYYVVSDLLDIPNLRAHGRKRLAGMLERLLFGIPVAEVPLHGWRKEFALVHAICSVVFQVVWMSGLIIAVSSWARGLGIAMACSAVTVWAILPLCRWIKKIWTLESSSGLVLTFYQRRLIAIGTVLLLVLQYLSVHTSPLARRVPVVVRYQNEQIERAASDAFVTSVYVQCGERVAPGTLLMELTHPELSLRREQWIDQREVAEAKSLQYQRQGKLALSRAEQEQAQSLDRRINELTQQIDELRIIAKRDGKVTTPHTDRLLGSFVNKGDELIRVADPQEKETLAVVAENDMRAFQAAASARRPAAVRLRGGTTFSLQLQPLKPAARRSLPHPALSASVGGPLAIQLNGEQEQTKLVKPQLESVMPLDALTSQSVKAGQIGRLVVPDDRTLMSRLIDWAIDR